MKEQEPNRGQDRLTNQANSPKLKREGDIFMAGEGNGNGGPDHGAPQPDQNKRSRQPRVPRATPAGTSQPDQGATGQGPQVTPEQINVAKVAWDVRIAGASDSAERQTLARLKRVFVNQGRTPADVFQAEQVVQEKASRKGVLDIDEGVISDPGLVAEVRILDRMLSNGIADASSLRTAYQRIDRLKAPEAEKDVLLRNIAEKAYEMDEQTQAARREMSFAEQSGQDQYTEEQLLTNPKARDEVFNSFFADADATPSQQFREAFDPFSVGMQHRRFLRTIRQASTSGKIGSRPLTDPEKEALRDDYRRYVKEHDIREALHNANYVLYFPVQFKDLADSLQGFRSELGDLANRTTGVKQMIDLFEAAIREDMAANNGYLRPEAVLDRVKTNQPGEKFAVDKVKKRFREMWESGQIFSKDEHGNSVDARLQGKTISEWEIDKIFSMARGMEVVSLRLLSLAAESKLPEGGFAQYTSLWLQDLLQGYSGYMHILTKYGVTEAGLRPYLYNEDKIKRMLGVLGTWNPKAAEEMWKEFETDPRKVIDAAKLNYIQRLNPNRCGDIFTWASWRFDNKNFDAPSAAQQFIINGRAKMYWRQMHSGKPLPEGEDWKQWVKSVPANYVNNEYGNWIGTGLRFEKLRGALADPDKRKDVEVEAKKIMERMSVLQPHRLYLVSEKIRGRLLKQKDFSKMSSEQISTALFGLSKMESAMYARREQLLNEGKTFDSLSLEEFYSVLGTQKEKDLARKLADAVGADYAGHMDEYSKEFVTDREYTHGFVLWTGDVPVDEFNMTALGDTGGYARRLRDNKAQTEALSEEMKLLSSLADIKTPEQLVGALEGIYKKIAEYDPIKAKEAIYEKAVMLLKFFKEESFIDILPVGGPLARLLTRTSAAQLAYGKTAASWGPAALDSVLIQLRDRRRITDERFKDARGIVLADKRDIGIEVGSAVIQFMALAAALYLLEQLLKSETSPQR